MKAVQLLVESHLPPDLRNYNRKYDAKGIGDLMADVARSYPDKYENIARVVMDAGRHASYAQGESLTLDDFKPVFDREGLLARMDAEVAKARKENPDDDDFRQAREKIWLDASDDITKMSAKGAAAKGTSLSYSVSSGARGKDEQLKALVSTPGIYTDAEDHVVPMFIRHSFGQGLRPAEYLASTYGARKTVVAAKAAVAAGGDWGKQLAQSGATVTIMARDCGTTNGIDIPVDDASLKGRVLARDIAGAKAGTVVDRALAAKIARSGEKSVLVRSALTCSLPRGMCAKCAGVDARGRFPKLGDSIGVTSANATSEPVVQGALNCLVEDTLVRMADFSTKKIQDVKVGDWVLGSDLQGNTAPVKVLALHNQGVQPVQRYTYAMGQTKQRLTLECTKDHPVLSNKKITGEIYRRKYAGQFGYGSPDNWKSYKLPAGYAHKDIAAVLPVSCTNPKRAKEDALAVICGVLLGDGIRWEAGETPVKWSCADASLVRDVDAVLQPYGMRASKCKRSHDYKIAAVDDRFSRGRQSSTTGQYKKEGFRSTIKKKVVEWGLEGKYAHDKRVPTQAWRWGKKSIAAMLAGYIATDGSIGKNAAGQLFVSFGSVSREMLEDLKQLMAVRLNVYSSAITRTSKKGTNNYVHDMWAFYVTRKDQIIRLLEMLPTIPGCKGPRAKALLKNTTYKMRNLEPFYRAKRKLVEELGVRQCWDLSVGNVDELFVLANGLIVKNTKHLAGMGKGKRTFSGFNYINQFTQTPEEFPDRAAVSEVDGTVDGIEDAPQGGKYITVGGEKHYVQPGFEIQVKPGQKVEAGDQLSDGLMDPNDVIRLRGLGEGRRYYAERLKTLLDDSGFKADRVNTEVVARSAIDHVVVDDPEGLGDYLPDDVGSYNHLAATYTPPEHVKSMTPHEAKGQYLHAPVLHYTIGTRVTPRVAQRLVDAGFNQVQASEQEPAFHPEMVRLRTAAANHGDWMAGLHTSYLRKGLAESAVRGEDTNIKANPHFAPRLAYGEGFGQNIEQTGNF